MLPNTTAFDWRAKKAAGNPHADKCTPMYEPIPEWAVIQHTHSLIGKSPASAYAVEGLGDLTSWSHTPGECWITTIWSRGHSTRAEAERSLKAMRQKWGNNFDRR